MQGEVFRIDGSALDRQLMMLVLSAIAGQGIYLSIVSPDGNLEAEDFVTGHHVGQHVIADICLLGCLIDKQLHTLEESWITLV